MKGEKISYRIRNYKTFPHMGLKVQIYNTHTVQETSSQESSPRLVVLTGLK